MDDCSQRAVKVLALRRRAEGATPATVADLFDQANLAFKELWERCAQATARKVSKDWAQGLAKASYDFDDALGGLQGHLWTIIRRYDQTKAQFSTWWGTCAERRVRDMLPQHSASSEDEVGGKEHGLDVQGWDDLDERHAAPPDYLECRSNLAECFARFVEDYLRGVANRQLRARTRDHRIFYLKAFNGESTSRLAYHFQVTEQVVSQAFARVQAAFADWMVEDDPDGWGARLTRPAATGGRS